MQLTVSHIEQLTPAIRAFTLRSADGGVLPGFEAGAHVRVSVHLPDGSTGQRAYSLVNAPSTTDHYTIAVLRQGTGRGGSAFMHDQVQVGTTLDVTPPVNAFALDARAKRHLLIAGGIGITPLLSMARDLSAQGQPAQLHYFGRDVEELAFRNVLASLPLQAVTEHGVSDPQEARQRLTQVLSGHTPDTHLYVCGPTGMINSVVELAAQAGWPDHSVHHELFNDGIVSSRNHAFEVKLARSGRLLQVPADKSLLDVLLAQGIDAPHDCRNGVCGSCLTPVLEGDVDHRDTFLTPDDRIQGGLMCPCVSRAQGARLVIDC